MHACMHHPYLNMQRSRNSDVNAKQQTGLRFYMLGNVFLALLCIYRTVQSHKKAEEAEVEPLQGHPT